MAKDYEDDGVSGSDEGTEKTEKDRDHWLVVPNLKRDAKNIAEQMEPEQRKRLGSEIICRGVSADLDSRKADMESRWDRWAKLYVGRPEASALSQRSGAPNLHTPGSGVAIDQYTARAAKYLFPSGDTAKAHGTGSEDSGRAWRVAKLLNYFIEYRTPGWRRTGETAIKQSALFGLSVKKRWWDPTAGTIQTVAIPAEDFIVSYTHSGTLESAQRLTHRIRMTRDQIRERVNSGLFCEDAWDLEEDGAASGEREGLSQTRQELDGWEPGPDDDDPGPMEVYETHTNLDLDGDGIGEPYIVTVHVDTEKVLRVVSRTVKNKSGEEETVRFFTPVEFDYNPLGFYALGIGAKTEGLNLLQNSLANAILFLAMRNGFPPKFCSKKAFKQPGDKEYDLDEWIESEMGVDDLSKSMFIAPTVPAPPILFDMYQEAGRLTREVVSLTELNLGQKQPHNQAARTTEIIREEGAEMFNGSFRRMLDALTDELRGFFQLLRLHLTDEEYNEILGDTGQPEYYTWKQAVAAWQQLIGSVMQYLAVGQPPPPELLTALQQAQPPPDFPFSVEADFADTLDIIPTADPNFTSESARTQVAQAVMEQVMPDPQASPRARWAARKHYYEALRVPAEVAAQVNPEPEEPGPPPNLGPLETLVALLRGQPVAVLPDQEHSQYIAAIEEYRDRDGGAWWQNTAPETREAIERHKQERMAAHLEREAQSGQQAPIPALASASAPAAAIVPGPNGMGGPPGGVMVPGGA